MSTDIDRMQAGLKVLAVTPEWPLVNRSKPCASKLGYQR